MSNFGRNKASLWRCCGRSTRDEERKREKAEQEAPRISPIPILPKLQQIHEDDDPDTEEAERECQPSLLTVALHSCRVLLSLKMLSGVFNTLMCFDRAGFGEPRVHGEQLRQGETS